MSADKEHLQARLADVEALRIAPLYKTIDSLTADIAARDDSILAHQGNIAALQAQIGCLDAALDVKRGKKQAYKIAFTGKVGALFHKLMGTDARLLRCCMSIQLDQSQDGVMCNLSVLSVYKCVSSVN